VLRRGKPLSYEGISRRISESHFFRGVVPPIGGPNVIFSSPDAGRRRREEEPLYIDTIFKY
jgi:hypothetical protein